MPLNVSYFQIILWELMLQFTQQTFTSQSQQKKLENGIKYVQN